MADTVWTAILHRLEELKFTHLWLNNKRPSLESYFERLKSRPSFVIAIQKDRMPLVMLFKGLCRIYLGI
ncbi:hypothetical protein [Pleurocapsa sp. PCC 7319]|uniref:hypothetical protein n=1 Tax=Pleurocapsa sp. PCC 7319 TaxID=118161 RepID=UPI0003449355|nr:hypothetical protein [Pleurocapsa sp. PCC 7319]